MSHRALTVIAYSLVGLGGVIGASARWLLQESLNLPAAGEIALINVVGSAVLAVILIDGSRWFPNFHREFLWRPLWATGIMGGFTTTSAWAVLSIDTETSAVVWSASSLILSLAVFHGVSALRIHRGATR